MDKSSRIFLGIGIALGVLVLGLLCFILISSSSNEEVDAHGLMGVCWQDNGLANFDTTFCDAPETITWPLMPLRVLDPEDASSAHREALRASIEETNEEVGCEVFQVVQPNWQQEYEVSIFFEVPVEGGADGEFDVGGATSFSRAQGQNMPQRAYVDIFAIGLSGTLLDMIIRHELGHVLGLDHDDLESSIMRRRQTLAQEQTISEGGSQSVFRGQGSVELTSEDRELLRTMYCPVTNNRSQ